MIDALRKSDDVLVAQMRDIVNEYISASLSDPDLAAASEEFRAGYERGFREAAAGFTAHRIAQIVNDSQIRTRST